MTLKKVKRIKRKDDKAKKQKEELKTPLKDWILHPVRELRKRNMNPFVVLVSFSLAVVFALTSAVLIVNFSLINRQQQAMSNPEKAKDYEIKQFQEALKREPNDPFNLRNLARAYVKANKFKEAIPLYKKAIELEPKNTVTYNELADVYIKQNKFPEAIDLLNESLKYQKDPEVVYKLGFLYMQMGNLKKAAKELESCFDMAYNIDIGVNAALYSSYLYLQLNNTKKAEEVANKILKYHPDSYYAYMQLSRVYTQEKKFKKALDYVDKAYKINPSNDILLEKADIYIKANNKAEAEKLIDKFKDSKDVNTKVKLAQLYIKLGKKDKAKDLLKTSLKEIKDPTSYQYKILKQQLDSLNNNKVAKNNNVDSKGVKLNSNSKENVEVKNIQVTPQMVIAVAKALYKKGNKKAAVKVIKNQLKKIKDKNSKDYKLLKDALDKYSK